MPIKPENKKRYPVNWKDIRKDILKRADNKCEFCGIENYAIRENGSKVVLTIAHLDHTPENCDYNNLRALCQKCHNKYDGKHRAETRRKAGMTNMCDAGNVSNLSGARNRKECEIWLKQHW